MDFKVAGTSEFVTALQLDTKIYGLPSTSQRGAGQSRDARMKILEVMNDAIAAPRSEVRDTAPKIVSFEIPIDKIGEVIGPKGKVINTIQQETGADISVGDDGMVGTVSIGSKDGEKVEEAKRRIMLILDPPTAELGAIYKGRVVNITKFGAFVNVLPGTRRSRAHLEARPAASASTGSRTCSRSAWSSRSRSTTSTSRASSRSPSSAKTAATAAAAPTAVEDRVVPRGDRPERAAPIVTAHPVPVPDGTAPASGAAPASSFEDFWEDQAKAEFGDLGPAPEGAGAGRPGGGGDSGSGGARRRRPPRRR